MASGESKEHKNLKHLSLLWAKEHGYSCHGCEITLPHSGYRADVVAYKPASEPRVIEFEGKSIRQRHAVVGSTAVFECKQARADLLRDSCIAEKTKPRLQLLHERRMVLERLLKVHLPSAANGDSLFQEYQTYSLETANHRGYQKVLRDISTLQTGLFRKTKFEKLIRYRCANLFYLVTVENIFENYELPPGWGHLIKAGDSLQLVRKPVWHEAAEGARLAVLQRLAMAGTRFAFHAAFD